VEVPIELAEQHRAGVERVVHQWLIHNTPLHPPHITIEVKQETAALRG